MMVKKEIIENESDFDLKLGFFQIVEKLNEINEILSEIKCDIVQDSNIAKVELLLDKSRELYEFQNINMKQLQNMMKEMKGFVSVSRSEFAKRNKVCRQIQELWKDLE